jgi:hypothetical protein
MECKMARILRQLLAGPFVLVFVASPLPPLSASFSWLLWIEIDSETYSVWNLNQLSIELLGI